MISILVPTRGRPAQFRRMLESAVATAASRLEIVAYVDDDDPDRHAYLTLGDPEKVTLHYVTGPRITLSNCWNECFHHSVGNILCQGNDDIIFRTGGWDQLVENAFSGCSDQILLVHGSDGSRSGWGSDVGKFGAHPFVSRKWVETVGYFTPSQFSSDYGDTWLNFLADRIGRRKYIPFVIEHMHYMFGKAPIDQTTRDRLERHQNDKADAAYEDSLPTRLRDAAKLRNAMEAK